MKGPADAAIGAAWLGLAFIAFAPSPAAAQVWRQYTYAEGGFSVQFPAQPTVSQGLYHSTKGLSVPATTYSTQYDKVEYGLTVADFTGTSVGKSEAIADAVKALGADGQVTLNVEQRIDQEYGRAMGVAGRDGSRSMIDIFFVHQRLYVLVGKMLPPDPQARSGQASRFQQSLLFTGERGLGIGEVSDVPRRPPIPPQAFEACNGKAAGDAVQRRMRGVLVAATCVRTPRGLVARPDQPSASLPDAEPAAPE